MEKYKEYKDSGFPWIGEIPIHWEMKRVSSFLIERKEKYNGNNSLKILSLLKDRGIIPYDEKGNIGNKSKEDMSSYKITRKGDVVVNCMNVIIGSSGITNYDGYISPAYYSFIPVNKEMSILYKHWLSLPQMQGAIRSMAKGILEIRLRVSAQQLLSMKIPIPPCSEQKKIISFIERKISKIDEYINSLQDELNLYKELIESIIYSRNSKDKNNIIFTSWEEFFDSTWQTGLGKSLFEEVEIKGISTERFLAVTQDKGLIYKDVDGINYLTAEKKETQKLVCPGEFVISLRSFEGGIEYSTIKGLVSPAYVILKLKEKYNTREYQMYFRFLFKSVPFISRLNSISDSMRDGKAIKFSDIKHFPFPIPSDEKLKEITRLSTVYDIKKQAAEEKIKLLDEYKQRLIADCVTGQINVQNE